MWHKANDMQNIAIISQHHFMHRQVFCSFHHFLSLRLRFVARQAGRNAVPSREEKGEVK